MSAHPAEIRDAIQVFIERAYRPVGTLQVQMAVTGRLDTYMGMVGSQMLRLERDGKIAKYVSPGGTEYWYSPKSETFCGTCGGLALPGVHPNPDCSRYVAPPGAKSAGTTEDEPTGTTEVSPGQAATLSRYAVQSAERQAQADPQSDDETPGDYTLRLVTAVVLHLVRQGVLLMPDDLE